MKRIIFQLLAQQRIARFIRQHECSQRHSWGQNFSIKEIFVSEKRLFQASFTCFFIAKLEADLLQLLYEKQWIEWPKQQIGRFPF